MISLSLSALFCVQQHIKQASRLLSIPGTCRKGPAAKQAKKNPNPEIMKMFNMCWPQALFSVFPSAAFHAISVTYCLPCKCSSYNFIEVLLSKLLSTCALWRDHPTAWEAQATRGRASVKRKWQNVKETWNRRSRWTKQRVQKARLRATG